MWAYMIATYLHIRTLNSVFPSTPKPSRGARSIVAPIKTYFYFEIHANRLETLESIPGCEAWYGKYCGILAWCFHETSGSIII